VSCPLRISLGAYVLGALEPPERDAVDLHLAECDECRAELERLLPLPRYLSSLGPADVARLKGLRPLRRWVAGAALTAATLGVAAALARGGGDGTPPSAEHAAAVDHRSGVSASVVATPREWGSELSVRMRGAVAGELCRLVARGRDGRSEVAGTWRASYEGSAVVTGSAAIPLADLADVDVVTAAGQRLVSLRLPPRLARAGSAAE
jgi:hypothetical protein